MTATSTANLFITTVYAGLLEGLLFVPNTVAAKLWWMITSIWSEYWLYIIGFLTIWIILEILTRNGSVHYNSKNGFSPMFNRFVGSGTLLFFQFVIHLVFTKLFGNEVYLYVWPYVIHLTGFFMTGSFLNLVGFWKYWKLSNI